MQNRKAFSWQFETVCQAARSQKSVQIQHLQESGYNIHQNEGAYSPIMWLAQEGNVAACHFLIQHYHASPFAAAMGYALGGHVQSMADLTKINAAWLDEGSAKTQQLLALGRCFRGAAEGVMVDLSEPNLEAETALIIYHLWHHDIEKADFILSNANKKHFDYLADIATEYAAIFGCHEVVDHMMLFDKRFINAAVLGYAYAGNLAKVAKCLENGASLNVAAAGYARGGHEIVVDALLSKGASVTEVVKSYLMHFHYDAIESLIKRKLIDIQAFMQIVAELYIEFSHFPRELITQQVLMPILSSFQDAKELRNYAARTEQYFIFHAATLSELRQQYSLTYQQAEYLYQLKLNVPIDNATPTDIYAKALTKMRKELIATDMKAISKAINRNFYNKQIKHVFSQAKAGFFGTPCDKDLNGQLDNAKTHYEARQEMWRITKNM